MHEHQLRRAVLLVLRCLLYPNLRQIPNVDAPVARRGREDRRVVRRPREVQYFVRVALECVQFLRWGAQVVEDDRLCVFE